MKGGGRKKKKKKSESLQEEKWAWDYVGRIFSKKDFSLIVIVRFFFSSLRKYLILKTMTHTHIIFHLKYVT